jgi:hypothetical protein
LPPFYFFHFSAHFLPWDVFPDIPQTWHPQVLLNTRAAKCLWDKPIHIEVELIG